MWLRDSQNQVVPYLRFGSEEPEGIGSLLRGLVRKHVDCVLQDPYANSFQFQVEDIHCNPNSWLVDNTTKLVNGKRVNAMSLYVHQRKFEMDSLCSVLRLGRLYFDATNESAIFDEKWEQAMELILETFEAMQRPLTPDNFTQVHTFQTQTSEPKDTMAHGIGRPGRYTGMIRTGFLPSDDSLRLPYHIPGNAMAVVELRGLANMLTEMKRNESLSRRALNLADEIDRGIREHGIVTHSISGKRVFAQLVDGFGNFIFADDANLPSLLSMPYIGYVSASDKTYMETKRLLLSRETNPFYFGNTLEEWMRDRESLLGGIGSEDSSGNSGLGRVWPLSLISRLLVLLEEDKPDVNEAEAILSGSGGVAVVRLDVCANVILTESNS